MFIATVGAQGFVTKTLNTWFHFKITDHGFSLYTFRGVALVYMYFQIPLMVIVMLPAIEGMKVQWREAAEGLGASRFQYWLRVGFPVLLPAALSGIILLFANAFSAYATAYALTSGQVNLVPIQIGFFLSGNTLDDPGLGFSLAFWMIVVVSSAIVLYNVLRRRTSRWQR